MEKRKHELRHYGTPRHSGRYPWGSGENPYQRNRNFVSHYRELEKKGLTDAQIAKGMNMSINQLRARYSIAKDEILKSEQAEAMRLKDKGYSTTAIGRRMGKNESSVRSLLDPSLQRRRMITTNTANALKDALKERGGYLDIGAEVNRHMGNISESKLKTAVQVLQDEGYTVFNDIKVKQLGTGKYTTLKVLAPPGSTKSEIYKNLDKIHIPGIQSEDGGETFRDIEPPRSISSDRIKVVYGDQGGKDKDGLIELRRGVEDLNLGHAKYAQVRVAVDGTHYMKGMAIYNDDAFRDLPKGIDVIYNSNKPTGSSKDVVYKEMKDDPFNPGNPFGATIKNDRQLLLVQRHYTDSNGKEQLSALNIVNEEGNWGDWSKSLSSQFLSKQKPSLAKKQLNLAYEIKKDEFDEIMSLTEPSVKKKLLKSFSDECDSDAVSLKAAGMPRQGSHVILPFPEMKDNEIYAPNFRDGERVVLIRYPHGGIFEIPDLVVNNHGQSTSRAQSIIGKAKDAVGINLKVAEKLSGADFDGDTVLVIPNPHGEIKSSPTLKGLKDFDPKELYKLPDDAPKMKSSTKQNEMGKVSNLITDMTIGGAPPEDICKAVKHSMVVIDAEKHHLNYKQSFIENDIAALKKKYQMRIDPETGNVKTGAATLISRAASDIRIPEIAEGIYVTNPETGKVKRQYIDPDTGEKLYRNTGRTLHFRDVKKNGTVEDVYKPILTKTTQMARAKDAFDLSSGTLIEAIYATHANKLKALANEARKAYLSVKPTPFSKDAENLYSDEVASVNAKLNIALKNKPLERKAQSLANVIFKANCDEHPEYTNDQKKKAKNRALRDARDRIGAKKEAITFTEKEWKAVLAGAFHPTTLEKILAESNEHQVKELAMPRTTKGMSAAKVALARNMLNNRGYTQEEVAEHLGVSITTLMKNI